jgi:hypothetical protein
MAEVSWIKVVKYSFTTEFSCSSPSSKTFLMCRLMFCLVRLKELGHLSLRQPDGLILKPDVNTRFSVRTRVDEQFRTILWIIHEDPIMAVENATGDARRCALSLQALLPVGFWGRTGPEPIGSSEAQLRCHPARRTLGTAMPGSLYRRRARLIASRPRWPVAPGSGA